MEQKDEVKKKYCPGCEQELEFCMFAKALARKDGKKGYCRKCSSQLSKVYQATNKKRNLEKEKLEKINLSLSAAGFAKATWLAERE